MIDQFKKMQPILAYAMAHLDEDLSLTALARQSGISTFHLQRTFTTVVGETPKQLTLRLRLQRAAVMLLGSEDSILDIALSCGFHSHETFCRMFRRHFGITPSAYRQRGFVHNVDAAQSINHSEAVHKVGPCIGLYHLGGEMRSEEMTYSIDKKQLSPQPVLLVRRRIKRSEIAATIGTVLPHVFKFAQQHGIALAGLPFTRYSEVSQGLITIEPGMRVAASNQESIAVNPAWTQTTDGTEVVRDTLPGGPAATTIHMGPYDSLHEAYAALEQWIDAEGLVRAGAPWESYVTDPTEYPDPKDWRTDVFWPLKA